MTAPASADLQATLSELIDLALQGKQAHWNVVGPLFRPVHLELDDIVESAHASADRVAERLATLGEAPDGRVGTVAAQTPFAAFPAGAVPAAQAIALIGSLIDLLTGHLRARTQRWASDDPVSQGVLIAIGEDFEKHGWMLRAQLE